jgi:hypothetical protein
MIWLIERSIAADAHVAIDEAGPNARCARVRRRSKRWSLDRARCRSQDKPCWLREDTTDAGLPPFFAPRRLAHPHPWAPRGTADQPFRRRQPAPPDADGQARGRHHEPPGGNLSPVDGAACPEDVRCAHLRVPDSREERYGGAPARPGDVLDPVRRPEGRELQAARRCAVARRDRLHLRRREVHARPLRRQGLRGLLRRVLPERPGRGRDSPISPPSS